MSVIEGLQDAFRRLGDQVDALVARLNDVERQVAELRRDVRPESRTSTSGAQSTAKTGTTVTVKPKAT